MAGARVARRVASRDGGLKGVADEVAEDLRTLERLMQRLSVQPNRAKDAIALAAERLSRLKLNGRILSRSPLSDVVELETLVVGITGKEALWESLRQVPSVTGDELDRLLERAAEQKRRVEDARKNAAAKTFADPN